MLNPIIKFKFDKKLDQDLAWDFYSNPEFGGCDFWQRGALSHHPKLKGIERAKNPRKFLNKYISEYYNLHLGKIEKNSKKTVKYFNQSQNDFFNITSRIFNHYPWPRKKFTGVFSIFDFCPRFLDWGGFQVFLYDNRDIQLFTIFHEMLHFIFYDFALKTFPREFGKLNTEEGKFWELAEVFNAVIQSTNDFSKLHGKIKNIGYPNHKKLIISGKRLWKKNPDVGWWIAEMMRLDGWGGDV